MATAPADSGAEIVALGRIPPPSLRELLERERRAWLSRLMWDTRDAADVAAHGVATGVLDGVAFRHGARYDGFLTWQPARPVSRLCGGWLSSRVGGDDVGRLAAAAVGRIPVDVRLEGQLVVFDAQAALDRALAQAGCVVEPRTYLVASVDALGRDAGAPGRVTVATLGPGHVGACARLMVDAHRQGVEARINVAFRDERTAHEYLSDILAGHGCGTAVPGASVIGVRDGRVEGFCIGTIIAPGVGHVPQIAVDPDAQGRGLGRALLLACAAGLRVQGASRLTLSVSCANARAAPWYERLGFRELARFSAAHRDPTSPQARRRPA